MDTQTRAYGRHTRGHTNTGTRGRHVDTQRHVYKGASSKLGVGWGFALPRLPGCGTEEEVRAC